MKNEKRSYYVYVLFSLKDKKFYVGFSQYLKNRMIEHNRGNVISTKHRRPLIVIHYEFFINRIDALSREKFLKSGFGRDQLRASLKRTLKQLIQIIKSPSQTW
ncbi:MAG: GIY-YIG nuclease family protein [Patescibacteria group bacterium]|nr:GIY-YIG nuclease family protein [Patescibacteria group bacterium]